MEPITATVAAVFVGKEMVKHALRGVASICESSTQKWIEEYVSSKKLDKAYKKIAQFGKVKTIWQVDKAVSISRFYCDSNILMGDNRFTVRSVNDLPENDNVVIEGIAGQGKSILLRYLCANELEHGSKIPVFIELRRVNSEFSLQTRIREFFSNLEFENQDYIFDKLAKEGKAILLLDAFDELNDSYRNTAVSEIENYAQKYDAMRIVVTSRPGNTIRHSQFFTVVQLDNLNGEEYKKVIKKLSKGEEWSKQLIEHINSKATHVVDLLCTPLLVTLLVMSYKLNRTLPSKLSEFYESLFETFLNRHDGSKPGYSRERKCDIDDTDYRRLFDCFCMASRSKEQLDEKDVVEIAATAIKHTQVPVKPKSFVDDIVKITCLLLRDGEEYRFIHKTVQEYYTASYVKSRPDSFANTFYSSMIDHKAPYDWSMEMGFLSEIDNYRYNKFYFVPVMLRFFDATEESIQELTPPFSQEMMRRIAYLSRYHPYSHAWSDRSEYGRLALDSVSNLFITSQFAIMNYKEISRLIIAAAKKHPKYADDTKGLPDTADEMNPEQRHRLIINFVDFIDDTNLRFLQVAAQDALSKALENTKSTILKLRSQESTSLFDSLL